MPAVKREAAKGVKTEKPKVKNEPVQRGIKQEVPKVKQEQGSLVKKERSAVKAEPGSKSSAPSVKGEPNLPPLKAKVEQLRQMKKEMGSGGMAELLARGLEIRKENEKKQKVVVKREKGKKGQTLVKVKKERSRNKDGTLRKKPRVSAKMRKARSECMNREVALSEELSDLLGQAALSRPETVRKLWFYCKEKGMLNPSNRREIHFDDTLEQMLGKSTATMPELIGLLTPHFDYTRSVVEVKKEMKVKLEAKKELKAEKEEDEKVKCEVKGEVKTEKASCRPVKGESRLKTEPSTAKRVKTELATDSGGAPAQISILEETLSKTVPRILRFDQTSAVVHCRVPEELSSFEVVVVPVTPAAAKSPGAGTGPAELRAECKVELQEGADGFMEPCAQAQLVKLDPKVAYRITIRAKSHQESCSCEAALPQRAAPGKWSQQEALVWCMTQQVPELIHKVKEYSIDGTTLLSLVEEDLRQMGVVAPFLLRRLTSGLEALRVGGA